jgi:choline transport protein
MADPDYKSADPSVAEKQSGYKDDGVVVLTEEVNASGHRDQLERQYGLLSICATALTIGMLTRPGLIPVSYNSPDNAWIALGGSITVSVFNGGPPGVGIPSLKIYP